MHLKTLSVLCVALVGSGAFAQVTPAEPEYTLAFNAGLTSDYRFRGISQSRFDPAVFGGIDFGHKSGIYLGTWASSIKWIKDAGGNSDAEIDFYGGYKGAQGDIGYDLGVVRYQYPSHNLAVSPNTTELYGGLTFGPLTAKYFHSVTNAFGFGGSKNSGYLDISALFDLGNGWSIVPHVGRQKIDGSSSTVGSYTDFALTVNKDFGSGFVVSLAAIGSNTKLAGYAAPGGTRKLGRDTAVLTLKYNL